MKKVERFLKENTIIGILIVIGITTVINVGATNIILATNVTYSNKKTEATTVSGALDELITLSSNAQSDLSTLKAEVQTLKNKNYFLEVYPVGSIYITTSIDENTAEKMASKHGGAWQVYGAGRTLMGTTTTAESTGGSSTANLSEANLPSHSHSFTPAGTINSKFTGTSSSHTHNFQAGGNALVFDASSDWPAFPYEMGIQINEHGGLFYDHNKAATRIASASITPAGTVTSTFRGSAGTTGNTGQGTSFSVQNPYITVYMWKRVS